MNTDDQSTTPPTDPDTSEQAPTVEGIADVSVVPQPPTEAVPVHWFAATFPMLEGEELDDLVDSIRDNGLRQHIVLDTAGQLIDGRNRLKACVLAGVEPTYTTVDAEPIAYILGANVTRRHLSKGQCAMAHAFAHPEPENENGNGGRGRKTTENFSEFSAKLAQQARFVLRHAPNIAVKVMKGLSSLQDAYATAMTEKRERDEFEQDRKQTRDSVDVIVAIGAQLTSKIEKWETAFLNQEAFVRQVHADAKAIIEHATKLAKI